MKIERRSGARPAPPAFGKTPAILALLLQIAAFLTVLLLAAGLSVIFQASFNILVAAILQGAIAAVLSCWCRQAWWWWIIQFLFPILLIVGLALQLPPILFLAAFLTFLVLYWSTFRTQVPYYPSRLPVWQAVEAVLPEREGLRFIDIGCGFGGLVLHLAQRQLSSHFSGIEIAPLPWAIARLRACMTGSATQFIRGDYRSLDLADYDVVFAYLSPVAMPGLWEKAHAEMRPGSLLLSYEFPIVDVPADEIVSPQEGGPALHVWRL
ncbi:class I SAM-dependent methyltransferase [Oxalicibacterium solurbis]|uniref:Methyltransferase domain-containing protein n=1 Tax=Oxalicibacterium solurbis TaxID=69280 RepID=A0A8J3AX41_9BURK|nr:class I SAM-dependent methyltransferase [Oxalicibacterium solurbis]GGI54547.1 hypothetical protein GCM10011430_17210 [Oxalicibacterium solurbis]